MNLFTLFLGPLEQAELDYMITGSVAAMNYGEPRLTNDIDLILALPAASVPSLETAFPEEEYYRAPTEILLTDRAGYSGFSRLCCRPRSSSRGTFSMKLLFDQNLSHRRFSGPKKIPFLRFYAFLRP